jgi:hypothetical protein
MSKHFNGGTVESYREKHAVETPLTLVPETVVGEESKTF